MESNDCLEKGLTESEKKDLLTWYYNRFPNAKNGKVGCKYCNEYEDLPEHYIGGEFVGRVFDTSIDKDYIYGWHITLPSGADIGIRYCPFCGEELI